MYLAVQFLITVTIGTSVVLTYENGLFQMGAGAGGLPDSVKSMLDEGFSNQEIIESIKTELGVKRINAYIEKMYDGVELTDEEIAIMKSGEVEDSDEELVDLLDEFGRIIEAQMENNGTATNASHSDLLNDTDLVKELFQESDDSSGPINDRIGQNVPLPKPNYAYSPYDLIRLVKTEETIYKPLKKYIKKMEAKLDVLKSYAKDYEDTNIMLSRAHGSKMNFEEKAMAIVSNPLSSYKMIRRFAFKLPEVWRRIGEDLEEDLWKELSQVKMKYQPPNDDDWKDAIEALFRIQYYNGYTAKEFSKGVLGSMKSNVTLTAEECLEIGIRAMALRQHDFALEWLYLAKLKHLRKDDDSDVDINFLEQTLQFAIKEHNKAWDEDSRIRAKTHVFTKKLINPAYIEGAIKKSSEIRQIAKQLRSQEEYDYPIPYNFVSLCAGENLQAVQERSRLKCWLERKKDPYFYINPLKTELLNADPHLVQIYNVVGDKMISHIKKIAITKLERSQVVNYNDPNADDVSLVRTSSQTWIPQWHPGMGMQDLTKLIEKITGLSTRKHGSSEDFQVACYGTSHHYDEHLDAVQDARRTAEFGDRIATFMIYLSTVEEGGKTAFPVLGVAANAVKGSAVFWYNLKKNGQPDKRTWHGGCPVVHGVKWVMNNWILYNENFKNRLCSKRLEE